MTELKDLKGHLSFSSSYKWERKQGADLRGHSGPPFPGHGRRGTLLTMPLLEWRSRMACP